MAKKTDLIRVAQPFADAIRKESSNTGKSIVDISETLTRRIKDEQPNQYKPPQKKKRVNNDPFALSVEGF